MKNFLSISCLIGLLLLGYTQAWSQVTYRVGYDVAASRYRVYLTSTTSYTGNQARISTAQVTLLVPHATGANQFVVANQQNKQVGANTMTWNLNSRVDAPIENPTTDYLSFGFSGSGSPILFDIPANTEIELFSFTNSGPCLGAIALINNTNDPFMNLNGNNNSLNTNPGNQITILGRGGNAYSGNYGGSANCAPIAPDLSAAISGSASLTAGQSATYALSLTNVSSAATTGATTNSVTLTSGLTYIGFSGNGWAVSSSAGANGTTILTATLAATIAGSTVAPALSINVTGTASGTIAGAVSTAGDANAANNSYSLPVTVSGTVTQPGGATANLATTVQVSNQSPNQNESVQAVIVVTNGGPNATTGVVTQVTLPSGQPITSLTVSSGTNFVPGTGVWTIGTLAPGQSVTLTVTLAANTGGLAFVSNQITAYSAFDPDLTDNQASVCFTVPLNLCAGRSIDIGIPEGYTGIQWFRDGQLIPGATTADLTITQSGTYTVRSNNSCLSGNCCGIVVRDSTDCCAPASCIPFVVRRIR